MLRPTLESESFLKLRRSSSPLLVCLEQPVEGINEGSGGDGGVGLLGCESKGGGCCDAREGFADRNAETSEDGGRGGFDLFGDGAFGAD